jgi:hypothetical protein
MMILDFPLGAKGARAMNATGLVFQAGVIDFTQMNELRRTTARRAG